MSHSWTALVQIPSLPFTNSVTKVKLLNLFVPPFPHVNGNDNNNAYLTEFVRVKKNTFKMLRIVPAI